MKINLEIEFILNENIKITKKHIMLLKQIEIDKSISKAAKNIGISYKNAWDSLDEINKASKMPLFLNNSRKQGSVLSEFAKEILNKYDEFCIFKNKLNDDFNLKTSAQNKLKAQIKEIKNNKNYINLVCQIEQDLINVNISINALKDLDLKVFDEIYLIFKINFIELEQDGENGFYAIIKEINEVDDFVYFTLEFNKQYLKALAHKKKLNKTYFVNNKILFQIPAKKIIVSL